MLRLASLKTRVLFMTANQYPFIDLAVHERVRDHFAAGDAIVLFSADMAAVLWANGRGARLFGYDSVYDFLDQGPRQHDILYRQIEAAGQRVAATRSRATLTIRISSGFRSVPVAAGCETIDVAGEPAVLFTTQQTTSRNRPGTGMIDGLDDPGTHVAVIDSTGEVLDASPDFSHLGLTRHTGQMLATMAASDPSRLVKRPVPTEKGYLPAAIGKLSDDPALHLLLVVETVPSGMDLAPDAEETGPLAATEVKDRSDDGFRIAIEAVADIEETPDEEEITTLDLDGQAEAAEDAPRESHATAEEQAEANAAPASAAISPGGADPGDHPSAAREQPPEERFAFRKDSRATRFVWKIDADGCFREVSDEFAATVGPRAADISGTTFTELADRLHLDPDGRVGELLRRRDTWSGKTIWWPVEGTSLRVPIDLAALPTYTRDRIFDGFRGFGIIRVGDAVEDPHALGMTLAAASGQTADLEAPTAALDAAAAEEPASIVEAEREEAHTDPADPSTEDGMAAAPLSAGDEGGETVPAAAGGTPAEDGSPAVEGGSGQFDLPEGEKPALRLVENASPAGSEKIVQLPDRRVRREGLSPVEQAAFREIARQLDTFVGRRSEDAKDAASKDRPSDTTVTEPAAPQADFEPAPVADTVETASAAQEAAPPAETPPAQASSEPALASDPDPADEIDARDGEPNADRPPVSRERTGLTGEILDQMPVALLVHSGDTLIHGNPEFLRLTGYPSIEALAEIGGLDALLQRQDLEGTDDHPSGLVVVRANDDIVPVTARLQSVRFEDATALLLALMPVAEEPQALSERKEADVIPLARPVPEQMARLQVEAEELRAILETATDGVVILGLDGNIRSMNRAASALFNYDNDEIDGKPFVMLFAHESQKAIMEYLTRLSDQGVASLLNDGREVIGREASGGFIPLFMTIGRLTSSNGFCAVIRDVTQWKRTEEELRTAKRAAETANAHKSEFLAHVSHEIRTPLNAIIGFADIMATERFGPAGHPRYVEYANDIVRSGRHVLDIVNDLLDISKIEAGEMELEFAAVELNETVSETVSLVQPQANGQRVIIRTALSHAVPPVMADLRSVKQIVLNILSNAIRFTPSGGQIVVSTAYEANGSVVLRVRDTGIGMTRAELDLAMKPFRQVAGSTRKRGDGTGLGLPLTKAMVDANRATFAINSAPREGTLVEITFPAQRVLANRDLPI
ncbi:histidine kinase [Pseudorhizobium endolithicum]|uniref:histidine kinase n=2 Tax=Pseudorhizobium endolithicum TaxID=1191678 RepID=A0ABM8PY68_9HYPH|nr:histidine kinase [Pseudorhizobium endolithicum]